jgi:hypothetical protein
MGVKRVVKRTVGRVPGATDAVKGAWVAARQLGERTVFAFSGPPAPTTAILLASSGRSGSTWLGDMLAAGPGVQQIFEPLDPRNSAVYRRLMDWPADVQDLLAQEALVEDYLRPWVGEMERVSNAFEALAVSWAVENRVALAQLAGRQHYLIFYEWLSLRPGEEMAGLLRWLGLPENATPPHLLHRYSRMTSVKQRQSQERDVMTRLSAWQRELTPAERAMVLKWAERLEVPWYGTNVLPSGASGALGEA